MTILELIEQVGNQPAYNLAWLFIGWVAFACWIDAQKHGGGVGVFIMLLLLMYVAPGALIFAYSVHGDAIVAWLSQ